MINAGVKSGKLHQGHFNANQFNYLEVSYLALTTLIQPLKKGSLCVQGTVRITTLTKPVLIPGRQNMNRAMHGDIVAVEIFPREDWRSAGEALVDQDGEL